MDKEKENEMETGIRWGTTGVMLQAPTWNPGKAPPKGVTCMARALLC